VGDLRRGCANHPRFAAVVAHNTTNGRQEEAVDIATVYFGDIGDDVVDALIEEGEIFHCAGGFAIEHPLVQPCIQSVEGSLDSIEGLPVHVVERLVTQIL
jgi:septum formation protein